MTNEPPKKQPLKIIVDSNALFIPLQFKVDIFVELERALNRKFELILISPVKQELENLSKEGPPKIRRNATFALKLAEKCKFINISKKAKEKTDDTIIRAAQKLNALVFTNDKVLKSKLRDISMPVIYLREKSRLELDGLIT